jgi:hypothetical protein
MELQARGNIIITNYIKRSNSSFNSNRCSINCYKYKQHNSRIVVSGAALGYRRCYVYNMIQRNIWLETLLSSNYIRISVCLISPDPIYNLQSSCYESFSLLPWHVCHDAIKIISVARTSCSHVITAGAMWVLSISNTSQQTRNVIWKTHCINNDHFIMFL